MRTILTPLQDVLENYRCYLSRNKHLTNHCTQFMKRENSDPRAAEAEAIVFSWLRAEKLEPQVFEDASKGGPDFCCNPGTAGQFLTETTTLDTEMLSKRSHLPAQVAGAGGGAYALITDKLKATAQSKARQLSGHGIPTMLAIVSDFGFADLLLDRLAAQYLMTSAPKINVPIGGGTTWMSTDLRHSVFKRPSDILDASGKPIIHPALQSIGAILLVATDHREMRVVGLLNPDAVHPFDPAWLPKVPFVRFAELFSHANIATEWVQSTEGERVATFPHRHIR